LVRYDVSAHGPTELVASQDVFFLAGAIQEKVVCVEGIIAAVIEERAVIMVGTSLCENGNLASGIAANLCARNACLLLQFLNGIGYVEGAQRPIDLRIIVVYPVQRKVVRLCTHSRDTEASSLGTGSLRKRAWNGQREIQEIAIEHRQALNAAGIYGVTDRGL